MLSFLMNRALTQLDTLIHCSMVKDSAKEQQKTFNTTGNKYVLLPMHSTLTHIHTVTHMQNHTYIHTSDRAQLVYTHLQQL